jgi:hypothetical protein
MCCKIQCDKKSGKFFGTNKQDRTVQHGLTDTARRVVATRPMHYCQRLKAKPHVMRRGGCVQVQAQRTPFAGTSAFGLLVLLVESRDSRRRRRPTTPRPNHYHCKSSSSRTLLNSRAGSVPWPGPGRSKAG